MQESTQKLIDKVIKAHGNFEQLQNFKTVEIHTQIGGVIWPMKGHDGALSDVIFEGALSEQKSSWKNIFQKGYTSTFEPEKVELFDETGRSIETLLNPRESFVGHDVSTPWNRLQTVYFSSYATWNYATTPFNFLVPGVAIKQLPDWSDVDGNFERLEVIYPDGFATHSKRQVFYFDENGLLKRHDYWPEVLGGSSATQIIEDHKDFGGIVTGTKRNIYVLNDADNSYQTDVVLVSIDILDVKLK